MLYKDRERPREHKEPAGLPLAGTGAPEDPDAERRAEIRGWLEDEKREPAEEDERGSGQRWLDETVQTIAREGLQTMDEMLCRWKLWEDLVAAEVLIADYDTSGDACFLVALRRVLQEMVDETTRDLEALDIG
jgi:hypothetical protein